MMETSKLVHITDTIHLDRPISETDLDLVVDHVGFSINPPGARTGLDRRDHHILHYVEYGKGTFTCMGTDYPLKAGDLYLFPKNTNVSYCADLNDPWAVRYVGFYGSKDEYYVRRLGLSAENVALHRDTDPQLQLWYQQMLEAVHCPNPSRTSLAGYLHLILGKLLHDQNVSEDITTPLDLFHVVAHYIRTNLNQPLRISNIANAFHISQSQLFRIFKAQCGLSPHQYIEQTRIEFACRLIQQSALSFQEIALRCGYEYESHFYKSFQKIKGTTPSKYRLLG